MKIRVIYGFPCVSNIADVIIHLKKMLTLGKRKT